MRLPRLARIGLLSFVVSLYGCSQQEADRGLTPADAALLETMGTWNQAGAEELLAQVANPNLQVPVGEGDSEKRVSLLHYVITTPKSINRDAAVRVLVRHGADAHAVNAATGQTAVEVALDRYLKSYHEGVAYTALESRDVVFTLIQFPIDSAAMSDGGMSLLTAPIDAYDLTLFERTLELDYSPDIIENVIKRVKTKTYDDDRPRDKDELLKMLNERLVDFNVSRN